MAISKRKPVENRNKNNRAVHSLSETWAHFIYKPVNHAEGEAAVLKYWWWGWRETDKKKMANHFMHLEFSTQRSSISPQLVRQVLMLRLVLNRVRTPVTRDTQKRYNNECYLVCMWTLCAFNMRNLEKGNILVEGTQS